ncbi:IS630 family transposase [Azospirillum himalayense]|uniref:IS630 family transposase n=1 Tax=Azospirillum himalayense TaxID=654847 RepID=A0ABW0GCF1_9PROT
MARGPKIELTGEDHARLDKLLTAPGTPNRHLWRARIVLLSAAGLGTTAIVRRVGKSKQTVWRWQECFVEEGVNGLLRDRPRPGRPPSVSADEVRGVVETTLRETPANATHWSTRTLARVVGLGKTTIQKIWREHGLKPHLTKGFKVSNVPAFVEKVRDVVGPYIDPPEHAVVLSVDEKSQIQALERTQAPLPMTRAQPQTRTHDYTRHGTTTLFAALDVKTGHVIGRCMMRHRHQEFLRFLGVVDRETPAHLDVHLIADNYKTHKHPKVQAWLKRHPRFHMHFTPSSASWLNLVERLFSELTCRRLRRGIFHSVAQLQAAINRYLRDRNGAPKPFIWTKSADTIIRKWQRAKRNLTSRAGH